MPTSPEKDAEIFFIDEVKEIDVKVTKLSKMSKTPKVKATKETKTSLKAKDDFKETKETKETNVIRLNQSTFDKNTTVVLDEANTIYLLTESVTFAPATDMPAVKIGNDDITFDLGGHSLTGSNSHATIGIILQRTTGSGTQTNISILKGKIRRFMFQGIFGLNTSMNTIIECIRISDIGNASNPFGGGGITSNGITNFLIRDCKVDSVTGRLDTSGIFLYRSTGKFEKCKISNISSSDGTSRGIEIFNDSFDIAQIVKTSFAQVANIKGAAALGLSFVSFLGRAGFKSVCVHHSNVNNVYASSLNRNAVGVEAIHVQKLLLRDIQVKRVTATVNASTPVTTNSVFAFSAPFSNVSFIDCHSSSIELNTIQ